MRCSEGNETTTRQLKLKDQESEQSISQQPMQIPKAEKMLYLKLQVFLWSLFSSISSPVYLQSWELYCWQCASINTERKETNPLRGMQVQSALKIPLFLHFKRCNIYPTYRYICVHLVGLQNTSFVFYIINCSRAHYGEAARRNAASKKIWLSSDT